MCNHHDEKKLKKIHPKANYEDFSVWTQPKISSMFKGNHPSQAVEPGPVLGQSDNAVVVGENQDNEGLPGQVDEESRQPTDCVKSTVLPTSAGGDSGDAELLGDLLNQQVGVAGVSSRF